MKYRLLKTLTAFAGIALLFGGCGTDSTGQFPGGINYYGFRVLDTLPAFNAEEVGLNEELLIKLSEAVDPNSVFGAVKITETVAAQTTDVSAEAAITLIQGDTLMVVLNRQWVLGARYNVTVNSTLRSLSGRSAAQYVLPFTTGRLNELGYGAFSMPGAPTVTGVSVYQNPYEYVCLGFLVEFSEDLATMPRVDGKRCPLRSCNSTTPLMGMQFYSNNFRSFLFTFPDGGCSCSYYSADYRVEVVVKEAVDLQGERMSGTVNRHFDAVSGLFSSDFEDMRPYLGCY